MKRAIVACLIAFASAAASAQSIAVVADRSVVVAHDGIIERFAPNLRDRLWKATGVANAGAIVAGDRSVAVLDPTADRAVMADLATGKTTEIRTGDTPVEAAFIGSTLYVVDRDARMIERIDGAARATLPLASDPAFLRVAGGKLYVYSRTAGQIQEITTNPFAVSRTIPVPPFASDFETDGADGYTVYPRDGIVRATHLETGEEVGKFRVGAVPVDIALGTGLTKVTSRHVVVADPSSKRVFMFTADVSFLKAFLEGFWRGFFLLGPASTGSPSFDSAVDRVIFSKGAQGAYDSATGTLYWFNPKKSGLVARNIAPRGFAISDGMFVFWQNGTLVAQKPNG